ncbi:hypothetical protein KSD_78180 [Ktedonobacter sp. SOSP1-85]|nr:hypothetical protein KSD_78180 [Ktedonobacter sp. SOSP1-85]
MEETGSITSFSDVLKTLRKQKKITQRQLAERLGVHYNTISMWERGNCLPESKGIVLTLARQLGLNEDQTHQLLEASLTALTPYWNVPYQRNPFFTGRESLLSHLYECLSPERSDSVSHSCALCGLGGVGKTQVAIEYAYRHFQEYSAVFWIHAETYESLLSSYIALADFLRLPEYQTRESSQIVTATIQWLNKHSNWLLIIDNVEDSALITPLLPVARKGSFLFTTQLSTLGALAESIQLEPMTHIEGVRFLLRRIRSTNLGLARYEHEDVTQLIGVMGGLPLALDQAGAYIEESRCRISDYLDLYQRYGTYLLQHRGSVIVDHPDTVYATLSLCLEKIRQRIPLAIELLYFCAFLSPEAIPEELIYEAAALNDSPLAPLAKNPLQLNEVIRELLTYSLLQRDARSRLLSIHRLVQDLIKNMMDEKSLYFYAERAVRAVNNKFPDSRAFTNWSDCQKYLPHAQLCTLLIGKHKFTFPEAAQLLFQVGLFLLQQSQYTQAEHLLLQALDRYRNIPEEQLSVADCLNNLATLYHVLGNYAQAESMLQEGLAIRQRCLGLEHQACAESLNDLSTVYFSQKKYIQAEEQCLQALTIWEKNLGLDHSDVAISLNNLASIYQAQEKYEQAESFLLRASTIWKKVLGERHPTLAFALANLAKLYQKQGKNSQAHTLFQRALAIREEALGPNHPRVARSLLDLASFYQSEREYALALTYSQRAFTIFQEAFGLEHADTVMASEVAAACSQAQSDFLQEPSSYSEADISEAG